jgi:hypothetical protein
LLYFFLYSCWVKCKFVLFLFLFKMLFLVLVHLYILWISSGLVDIVATEFYHLFSTKCFRPAPVTLIRK